MINSNMIPGSCRIMHLPFTFLTIFFLLALTPGCKVQQPLSNPSPAEVLSRDSSLRQAHLGISVFDPAEGKYLISYQDDKYFIPASNTKLFSLYAGLKFLRDSLPAIRYVESDAEIFLIPTGDPSFLHPDFIKQPVIDFLRSTGKKIYITDRNWKDEAWGSGWSWDDYNDDYMAERSALPVYGNMVRWYQTRQEQKSQDLNLQSSVSVYSVPEINWKVRFKSDSSQKSFFVKRKLDENYFEIYQGNENFREQDVPFITHGISSAIELLKDTVGDRIFYLDSSEHRSLFETFKSLQPHARLIHSRPVDSLFRIMMYRSDNFFAEQTLLLAANERLGIMNDAQMIDTLLKTDLNGLPEPPNWADGSGLSRYNLFSPRDFVWLLNKMKNEFGLERMKGLLPTGGSGTLRNYYKQDSGYIYAKTGSLSDVLCLSGYLYASSGKLLIFSVLVNNHLSVPSSIRRAVEKFIEECRRKY